MSVFVDTGVFYAAFDTAASRHDTARAALTAVLRDATYGHVVTSDYVYDETVTLTQQRIGSTDKAVAVGDRLRSEGNTGLIELLHVSQAPFDAAVACFERYDDRQLSFTDATTVAIVEDRDADRILSFDDDFDGIVDRLDPATLT